MNSKIDIKSTVIGVGLGVALSGAAIILYRPFQTGNSSVSPNKQLLPEAISPLTAQQLATVEPQSYELGDGDRVRIWRRIDAETWHEVYPDGLVSVFKVVGHAKVGDTEGTVVAKVEGDRQRTGTPNDGSLQAFIPDKGSTPMKHRFRSIQWRDLGEMKNIK